MVDACDHCPVSLDRDKLRIDERTSQALKID